MKQAIKLIAFSAATLVAACGSDVDVKTTTYKSPINVVPATEQIIDQTVIPAATDFKTQATSLSNKINNFCANKTTASLTEAQEQWKLTAEGWYRLLPFNFGPSNHNLILPHYIYVDSLRQRGVNYIETVRQDIDRLIAGSQSLTESFFANQTFNKMGLLALEVALFETAGNSSKNATDIVAEYRASTADRQCNIVKGYSQQLQSRADAIALGWTSNYNNSGKSYKDLVLAGELKTLPNEDETTLQVSLITEAQKYLDYAKKRSIASRAAQVSGYTWALLLTSLTSIEQMIMGASSATASYQQLLQQHAPANLVTIKANLAAAKKAIAEKNTTDFYSVVGQLDGNMKRELANGMDVSLGFNFTDGD